MDHPWASVYDFFVEREALSRLLGRLLFGTDARLLYDQLDAIAAVPDGGSILDIPCGGGVRARRVARAAFGLLVRCGGRRARPRPGAGAREIARGRARGGRSSGSACRADGGRRSLPLLASGRAAGLMGPSGSGADVRRWLLAAGLTGVELRRSGAIGYFQAGRAA